MSEIFFADLATPKPDSGIVPPHLGIQTFEDVADIPEEGYISKGIIVVTRYTGTISEQQWRELKDIVGKDTPQKPEAFFLESGPGDKSEHFLLAILTVVDGHNNQAEHCQKLYGHGCVDTLRKVFELAVNNGLRAEVKVLNVPCRIFSPTIMC